MKLARKTWPRSKCQNSCLLWSLSLKVDIEGTISIFLFSSCNKKQEAKESSTWFFFFVRKFQHCYLFYMLVAAHRNYKEIHVYYIYTFLHYILYAYIHKYIQVYINTSLYKKTKYKYIRIYTYTHTNTVSWIVFFLERSTIKNL